MSIHNSIIPIYLYIIISCFVIVLACMHSSVVAELSHHTFDNQGSGYLVMARCFNVHS